MDGGDAVARGVRGRVVVGESAQWGREAGGAEAAVAGWEAGG